MNNTDLNHKSSFPSETEPIAVIGMACQFPGASSISEFWQLLATGKNLIVKGPPGSVVGRSGRQFPSFDSKNNAVRFGAFIEDIDLFDAEFFRISPLEAQLLDPQQRMMLETSWQALEDAAINPKTLKGSRTGVYAGISTNDYRDFVIDSSETIQPAGGLYAVTGTALNTAIGRVSFALGLEGPSMAIDTACSSSLVAIHQAVGGLHRNETDLAIAGGVHIFLSGRPLELRANAGMLSPEGQCKTFDASADGFVCGEGCGLVVLKRLSMAEKDGDRIWAIIRGSSVNQDGASQGLTVPSGPSQERAMEDALACASVSPAEIDYLEAHGTGTVVGDPIEVNSAAAVYGRGRKKDNRLLIGSVKTNIGHLGPAAGIAGVIKTILSIRHGKIPQHLNFKNPNPALKWDQLPVRVTDEMMDWPKCAEKPPLAGVNSFGWSGTNAHVLIQAYEKGETKSTNGEFFAPLGSALLVPDSSRLEKNLKERETRLLPLSGKSYKSLQDAASNYLSWLDETIEDHPSLIHDSTISDSTLLDMVWTASIGRSHFENRAGIVFCDVKELREKLENLVKERDSTPAQHLAAKVAFVFTGQASQWVGMGRNLYETEPVFRSVLDQCDQLLYQERCVSLLDVMFGRNGEFELLDEPKWTQPAIYSLECALVALWESIGVRPGVVLGHSLGEIAAAKAAGVFTLEQGLRYAAARGELMGATRSDGAMAAIFAPASRVRSIVDEHNAISDDVGICIAVDNGLQQVVSGPTKDIEVLIKIFESEDIKVARLKRSPAYHSALVEPALADLRIVLDEIAPAPPPTSLPLISNLTGEVLEQDERMDADYWERHARQPVLFQSSVETLAKMGVNAVVEIGPHAVLGPVVSMIWPESSSSGIPDVIHSLRRPPKNNEEPMVDTSGGFVEAVASAYEAGLDINFNGSFAGEVRRRISLPSYPFQRERHWVQISKRRQRISDHPLLGTKHESPRGECTFESEMFPSDPAWLIDHLVYERIVAPGGLYGAMAVCVSLMDGVRPVVVDDLQMRSALIFDDEDDESGASDKGRKLQFVLDPSSESSARHFEIYSKGNSDEGWTLHAAGKLVSEISDLELSASVNLNEKKTNLAPVNPADFYQIRWTDQIYLGPSYHTLKKLWGRPGEAIGELELQSFVDATGMEMHPLLLDGCFQVLSAARHLTGTEHGAVYMPFGFERLWVAGPMPERIVCHAVLRSPSPNSKSDAVSDAPPEVVTGDVAFYSPDGTPIGGLKGYTVKRATQGALLPATEGFKHLFYEIDWKKQSLSDSVYHANFLASPSAIVNESRQFTDYLTDEGVKTSDRVALLGDQERLSQAYALAALEQLGWKRIKGSIVQPDELRIQLEIIDAHQRLFARILDLLTGPGILAHSKEGFVVEIGSGDALADQALLNPKRLFEQCVAMHPHGVNELNLLDRCGSALAEVLLGKMDPLPLLFSDDGPGAADLYLKAPASRAANQMLKNSVAIAIRNLPIDRPLRIIEVGAGTGSATSAILPLLPSDRVDYTFTDISAGFFAQAESRFSDSDVIIEYKALNIEESPESQGFDLHHYDLVIASNVLHATRDLKETLTHCRNLLAPSGQLIALEGLQRRAWQDFTFGLLDGWWRFADSYRTDHALASAPVWRQALNDTGFTEVDFVGPQNSDTDESLGSSVVIAQVPTAVSQSPGVWVVSADENQVAVKLAVELGRSNQTVILAGGEKTILDAQMEDANVAVSIVDPMRRESWQRLLSQLPKQPPLKGIVHLAALDGHGTDVTTGQMSEDVTQATLSTLALVQGVMDNGLMPAEGVWLVTRGAQVLERDLINRVSGELSGAGLWGFGRAATMEAPQLRPKMIDLDPDADCVQYLVDELLLRDNETHIAYRGDSRYVARLVRGGVNGKRLELPENSAWVIGPDDPKSGRSELRTKPQPVRTLESGEVRVAVESTGLNFADVLISMGQIEHHGEIGPEFYGRVLETAHDVENFSSGDPVVGLGFGAFATETVTPANLVAHAPSDFAGTALATMPICFTTVQLAFDLAGLKPDERVLIHAGTGGVGLAAIQLAQAAGAVIFATASVAKQEFLRSLGVNHVFDSRQTAFGEEILKATDGQGVDVVLNSLTGEGFIETSLSCLGSGGRFVEISKRNVFSKDEMSAIRPDVAYSILDLDSLKEQNSPVAGASLSRVMERLSAGELTPLPHTVWPLCEIQSAMKVLREARHIGKIVLRMPPLAKFPLRKNRTYLVTGGLGGIGCLVARWLAEKGAGTIVLNGRRKPDAAAESTILELRDSGFDIRVEVADVANTDDLDKMLARINSDLPPLGGVVHSVGVLSDGVIENQTWERFEQVLWPKVLGAWHLHQATRAIDLDFFVLFSSATGVMGSSGQTNHATANAFLDQLAVHRRNLGLPGQAIAWGAWAEIGEAAEQRERIERQLADRGTRWFKPEQGMEAFDWIVRQDVTAPAITDTSWSELAKAIDALPPFFETLLSRKKKRRRETGDAKISTDLLTELRTSSTKERTNQLESFIQKELQTVLRLSSAPSMTISYFDLGLDSLMAVQLRNRLNQALADEYTVSNTVIFDYPNVTALAAFLTSELDKVDAELSSSQSIESIQPQPQVHSGDNEAIAIVGMACRFPGASDLSAFWRQLEKGENAVADGRGNSRSWTGALGNEGTQESIYRIGGFVDDLDQFDARFFNILPIEARALDPQQRLLLETSWQALEDAGIDAAGLKGSLGGVYLGVADSEYRDLMKDGGHDNYFGNRIGAIVGRISFMLGLEGPAMPVELACASSLVSIHYAIAGLQLGETDLALAGGVNAILSKNSTKCMLDLGMLSPTGKCSAFDESADGFVRGEGCGIVVLKRLSDAQANGDRIWGVIRGSAINQNGASGGFIMPNGPAQRRVIEDALRRANIDASEVDFVEAHAVGSNMGDAIELQAMSEVYGKERKPEHPLMLGSVKANIGHLESAAGVAGLIKVMLAMRKGLIPKQLNFENPNLNINWDKVPLQVASETMPWPRVSNRPLRAGVSAFSLTGTNAHLIVEAYRASENDDWIVDNQFVHPVGPSKPVAVSLPKSIVKLPAAQGLTPRKSRLLPLSGKSEEALRELVNRYIVKLDEHSNELSSSEDAQTFLTDMAWTASTGRSHFENRVGIVFQGVSSLREALNARAESDVNSRPQSKMNLAFAYAEHDSNWVGMGEELYESEPVARAILDHCENYFQTQHNTSLLDRMFGRAKGLNTSNWSQPAAFALQCAITALWSSIGIQPDVVVSKGAGMLAAAYSSGVLKLEEGLSFAVNRGRPAETSSEAESESIEMKGFEHPSPSITMINQFTGQVVESTNQLDEAYWLDQACEPTAFARSVKTLMELEVDAVVEVSANAGLAPQIISNWLESKVDGTDGKTGTRVPLIISSQLRPSDDEEMATTGFVNAVAKVYEAGITPDLSGLFAGEDRCRISLPNYPFQRQRFWFNDYD